MPEAPIYREDPRQGNPLSAWIGRATEKDWPERASDRHRQEAWKKTLIGPSLLHGGSPCPCTLGATRVPTSQPAVPPSRSTLIGQSCHRPKESCVYACRLVLVVSDSLQLCILWPARLLCQGAGLSRPEYWSILANISCHTLLELYISCCPSCPLPWVPGAARTPTTQAPAPPPHLTLTESNPSPPGKPQEQTSVDDPMQGWKQNHNWNPGAVWLRKKTQNLPTSCTSCRFNTHNQLGRRCVYGIYKRTLRAPTK